MLYYHSVLICSQTAIFLLGADLYPYNEEDETMILFRTSLKNARKLVGNWEPGAHLIAALETIPTVHWQDPVLRMILDGEEIDEERGKGAAIVIQYYNIVNNFSVST